MKKIFLISLVILSFAACKQKISTFYLQDLASPVLLNVTETIVSLDDYFPNQKVDSVYSSDFTCVFDKENNNVVIHSQLNSPTLGVMHVLVNGKEPDLLLKKSAKQLVELSLPDKNYKDVKVKGEFNAWNPNAGIYTKDGNIWTVKIEAESGTYQYCLVINGKEQIDPANAEKVSNGMGGFNSVLKIGNADGMIAPVLHIDEINGNNIDFTTENNPSRVIAFLNNDEIPVVRKDNKFSIELPKHSKNLLRSYIRVYAFNNDLLSNDILIPLANGLPIENPMQLTRSDFHRQVIYSLMVDRFFDGNKNNNPQPLEGVLPKADYMGGDLNGIDQKIKSGYFDSLGITTIWISPIVQNPMDAWGQYHNPDTKFSGYHGYWPMQLRAIDFRFGTSDDFKTLIADAHKHQKNVILDYVANHVHINSNLYKEHPEWMTSMYLPDGTRNLERWDDYRLTTWFDTHLPKFDFAKYEVSNALSDTVIWWLQNYDLDGFRHDATKHIDELFWRLSTEKIKKEIHRPVYQIGETYGSPELIKSYVGSGLLDAQFDFNVYDASVGALISPDGSYKNLNNVLQTSLKTYGYHNLMGYISGNHDRVRFISYAGGSVSPSEDGKRAGWTREITVGDTNIAYKKLALLHAFNFMIPGVPCIYQGDEFGQPGGNDPDNRRMMQFDNLNQQEKNLEKTVSKLAHLRTSNMALIYGDFQVLAVSDDVMIIKRTYFGKTVIGMLNKSAEAKTLTVNVNGNKFTANFGSTINSKNGTLSAELKPLSFEIFSN